MIRRIFKLLSRTGVTKKPEPKAGTHAERARRGASAGKAEPPEHTYLTSDELLDTLRREVIAINRAAEMRIRELTVLVTDYARGKITPEEANERFSRYSSRWSDPIYGVSIAEGKTDEQILKEMADARPDNRDYWAKREQRAGRDAKKGPTP